MRPLSILTLTVLFLSCAACKPTLSTGSNEHDFQERLGLSAYSKIQYKGVDGTPMTYDQFQSAANNNSFTIKKDPVTNVATVRIDPCGTSSPDLTKVKLSVPNGDAVPQLKVLSLDGSPGTFSGKPTVLSFFFAECAPCIQEIPQLNALAKKHPELQFVSVTFDDRATSEEFVSRHGLQTKVVPDSRDFIDTFGVKTYPALALVSSDGHLIDALSGTVFQTCGSEDKMGEWLQQAIARN